MTAVGEGAGLRRPRLVDDVGRSEPSPRPAHAVAARREKTRQVTDSAEITWAVRAS